MKSVKFLQQAKEQNKLATDAALAEALGVTKSAVSQYMSGKRIIENETCVALALMLGIDPIRIIMAADMDRAERAGQHSLWEVFTSRTSIAASVLALVSVNLFLTPTPSEAAPVLAESTATVCIM